MEFGLTPEQESLRDAVVRFSRETLNEGVIERDRGQTFDRALWRRCGEMGLTGLPVPAEYGGNGLDAVTSAVVLEAFGYGCTDSGLVFSVGAHLLSCVVPIWKFGTEAQKRRWLPGLCDGSTIGVHAMSEPDSGSDAFALRTRADRDGDGWRLTGTKTFVSNGPVADMVIVFAMTDPAKGYHGGVTAFLVPRDTPGVTCGKSIEKMGLRTSPFGELAFDGAPVGPDAVLGQVGGGGAMFVHAMDWERALLFASHVGSMQRLLEKSVSYARTRTQFGQAIGKFQAVSHALADVKVHLEAARLLVYRAAWALDHARTASLESAMAKLFVSETLVRSALTAVQVHGGYGFTTEYEVERALRDAIGSTLYSGTSEIQRTVIARWLGL
jgi:alkylation response protein AidB-like acyl-CoA dehydrogenase